MSTKSDPQAPTTAAPAPRKSFRFGFGSLLVVLVVAAALTALIYAGITSRVASQNRLEQTARQMEVQDVSITYPKRTAASEEVVLPGNTQAFTDAPIYARTNGYLKRWYFDIGARVRAGQLIAEIETPEIDQQLDQARADLETATANYRLAQTTAARWQSLLKTESVSQQDTDVKVGDMKAKKAMVDSAASNVRRLEDLQSYEKVVAPFDGVITARNVDIGDLINAGASSTPGKELFHMAAIAKLRVYVAVPEIYQRAVRAGGRATLTLDEFPGRSFNGELVRNSSAIDQASRTLLVEVDVDNPTRELLPGAYASVHLRIPSSVAAVTIPVNTLLFRSEGLRVAVVRNGRAELTPLTIGRDFGNSVEVTAGLAARDQIIVNPPDSLISGEQVRVTGQVE